MEASVQSQSEDVITCDITLQIAEPASVTATGNFQKDNQLTINSMLIPGYLLIKSATDINTYELQQTYMAVGMPNDSPPTRTEVISSNSFILPKQTNVQAASAKTKTNSASLQNRNSKTNASSNSLPLHLNDEKLNKSISESTTSGKKVPPSRLVRVRCDICDKEFKKTYLKEHMKIHEEEKAYKCNVCGKRYRFEFFFQFFFALMESFISDGEHYSVTIRKRI